MVASHNRTGRLVVVIGLDSVVSEEAMSKQFLAAVAVLTLCLGHAGAQKAPDDPAFAGKPLSHWVGLLHDDSVLVREEAAAVLAEMGPAAKDALPELLPLLKAEAPAVRLRAAVAIWKIGRDTKAVLPVLQDALKEGHRGRRALSLQALTQMGGTALETAPILIAFLDDATPQERGIAGMALRQMGAEAIPAITHGLKRTSPEARRECVSLLSQFVNQNAKVTETVAERLKDEDKRVRLEAARALMAAAKYRKDVAAVLADALKDSDLAHRRTASAMVFMMSPRPKEFLEVFVGLLDDPDAQIAGNAANAVWELTRDAKRVTPTLRRVLRDPTFNGHFAAMMALQQMGPAAIDCLPALLNSPRTDPNSLGVIVKQIGPTALPDLLGMVNSNADVMLRRKAVEVLGNAGPDALPRLLTLANDSHVMVREAALRSIGAVGPEAKEALPLLMRAARDDNGAMRMAAISSIGKLGAEAKTAAPLLLDALKDQFVGTRYVAIDALAAVPVDAKTALPALDAALKEEKPSTFHFKVVQLRLKLDPDPAPVLPVLGELLRDFGSQSQVIVLLGQLGPKARDVLPRIIEVAQDARVSPYTRAQVVATMLRVDPEGTMAGPALVKLVGDGDRGVRLAALGAVAQLGQECDVGPIVPELKTADFSNRRSAHQALRQLGPKARGATPVLLEIVRGPAGPYSLEAAETLCKVAPDHREIGKKLLLDNLGEGPTAKLDVARAILTADAGNERALAVFKEALVNEKLNLRAAALSVLAQTDASAKAVLPQVTPLLKDAQPGIRIWAARAAVRIGGEIEPAVEVLVAALKEPKAAQYHTTALFVLGEIGPKARSAVPALTALLKERPPRLRMETSAALQKIDPEAARQAAAP
jgi:HEAT repeat protein